MFGDLHLLYRWMVEQLLVPAESSGSLRTSMYSVPHQSHKQVCWSEHDKLLEHMNWLQDLFITHLWIIKLALVIHHTQNIPVLQATLNILTESAVMTKASAQARWPICGLRPSSITYNITFHFRAFIGA